MAEHAVVSLGDDRFRPITDVTFPAMEHYAGRIGAAFHVIGSRQYPNVNICYEKLQLGDLLKRYRRLLYLDGDVLVRRTAPSVFDEVPYGSFGAMNEIEHIDFWTPRMLAEQMEPFGGFDLRGRHFNAGVMALDQTHSRLFEDPVITNKPYWDQPYFNVYTQKLKVPFHSLTPDFNFMVNHVQKRDRRELWDSSFFLHFAGTTMTPAEKAVAIREAAKTR